MGKVIIYIAAIIMFAGVIIQNFVYEFPVPAYILFLGGCILLAIIGYIFDRNKNKKDNQNNQQ